MATLEMMFTQVELPFVHRNPSCDGAFVWCWRVERECEKRVWSTKRCQGNTKPHLDPSQLSPIRGPHETQSKVLCGPV